MLFWGTTLVPLANPTLHTSHFPSKQMPSEREDTGTAPVPGGVRAFSTSAALLLHPRAVAWSLPSQRRLPRSLGVARAGGSPGSTASSVGPGAGGCLGKGPCDLDMQSIGPGLGKRCSLAFHLQTQGHFLWF